MTEFKAGDVVYCDGSRGVVEAVTEEDGVRRATVFFDYGERKDFDEVSEDTQSAWYEAVEESGTLELLSEAIYRDVVHSGNVNMVRIIQCRLWASCLSPEQEIELNAALSRFVE